MNDQVFESCFSGVCGATGAGADAEADNRSTQQAADKAGARSVEFTLGRRSYATFAARFLSNNIPTKRKVRRSVSPV